MTRLELVGGPYDGLVIEHPDAPPYVTVRDPEPFIRSTPDEIPPRAEVREIRYYRVSGRLDELERPVHRYVLEDLRL